MIWAIDALTPVQLEREQEAAEQARHTLSEKDALIRELSRESTQVDKER